MLLLPFNIHKNYAHKYAKKIPENTEKLRKLPLPARLIKISANILHQHLDRSIICYYNYNILNISTKYVL